jgi:hypothetical protein
MAINPAEKEEIQQYMRATGGVHGHLSLQESFLASGVAAAGTIGGELTDLEAAAIKEDFRSTYQNHGLTLLIKHNAAVDTIPTV